MNIIYNFLYEKFTDPLGLPINIVYEYIIIFVIDFIACELAFSKVGKMYKDGMICGKTSGSFFHWLIRFIFFVPIWFVTYSFIQGYYFVTENLQISLMIAGSIVGTAILCIITVAVMRLVKKHRTENRNA